MPGIPNAETTTTEAPVKTKRPVKKVAKKAVKKVAKKGKTVRESNDRGPSKLQILVLGVLSKSKKPLSRSQLSEKLDGAFIGGKVMGHADETKVTEGSLLGRGLVAWGTPEEGGPQSIYQITKAGIKALEEAKAK